MDIPTKQEYAGKVFERDTMVALSVEANTESGRPHSHVEVNENIEPDSKKIEDPEALFEVPLTKVAFFTKRTSKVRIGIGANRLVLCSGTCLVDTGAGLNLIVKAYLRLH